jgi:hypothetical protein
MLCAIIFAGTTFICGTIMVSEYHHIEECDPISKIGQKDETNERPFPLLVTIIFTTITMHYYILREYRASLDMMKFALNHPYKFQSWGLAFNAGLLRTLLAIIVEITNAALIVSKCTVTDTFVAYLAMCSLLFLDLYMFNSLADDMPFKSLVLAPDAKKPDVFMIERTHSMKNNWAGKTFVNVQAAELYREIGRSESAHISHLSSLKDTKVDKNKILWFEDEDSFKE